MVYQIYIKNIKINLMARLTGLEPATPGVTGRYSNQLSYNRPLSDDLHQRAALLGTGAHPVKPQANHNRSFSHIIQHMI